MKKICYVLLGQRSMHSGAVILRPSEESNGEAFEHHSVRKTSGRSCSSKFMSLTFTVVSPAEIRNLCLLPKQYFSVLAGQMHLAIKGQCLLLPAVSSKRLNPQSEKEKYNLFHHC